VELDEDVPLVAPPIAKNPADLRPLLGDEVVRRRATRSNMLELSCAVREHLIDGSPCR
jgi:hypothetical protein